MEWMCWIGDLELNDAWRCSSSYQNLAFLCTIFTIIIISLCVGAGVFISRKRSTTRPPGPRGLPIIGHLHLLGDSPHRALYNLSKVHGPLMWLRFGSVPVIVASTPDAARLILKTNDQAFSGRPRPTVAACVIYDCTDITFSPPNAYWKLMRQLCVTDLVNSKRLEGFRHIREQEARVLVCAVMGDLQNKSSTFSHVEKESSDGGGAAAQDTVLVRTKLLNANNNMISRMILGKTLPETACKSQADPSLNLMGLLEQMQDLFAIFNLGDLIPWVAWMDLQGVQRRSRVLARKMDAVLQEIIDSRRLSGLANLSHCPHQDLLDILLSYSSTGHVQISDDNIKAFILDMFVGGTDTSGYTAEWALTELLANPMKMKQVQEELDNVVGRDRAVRESDLANLPYLRAVVNETFRLHPVVPFLIPHESIQSFKLWEYDVPARALAYVNVWAIGRDPQAWDDPLSFEPERFLNSNVNAGGQHFQLLPFGSGRRGCPGWMLGLLSVQLHVASLLQGFYWMAPPNFDVKEKFGIMMMKAEPLAALARPRLPIHLYEQK